MLKSFAALSITTGVRLLTGLVLFVLIAREWPAGQFGQFMYLFSVAALLVLACEFGFIQQILREVGRAPEQAVPLMGNYLGAKIWLTLLTVLLGAGFALCSPLSAPDTCLLALLLGAGMAMSYADFYMACFRALGDFTSESKLTLKGNLLYFALASIALYAKLGPLGVAGGFLVARAVHLWLAKRIFEHKLDTALPVSLDYRRAAATITDSVAYGADVAVGAAFTNLDTVLIARTLGAEGVAIYQAAARFYQGACLLPPIFASLYLPKLAKYQHTDKPQYTSSYRQLAFLLLAAGVLGCIVFAYGAPVLALIYQQTHLQESLKLLPWLGLLVLSRYISSIYGIAITALGGQKSRAAIYMSALAIMVVLAPVLMHTMGLAGMVLAYIAANWFLALAFSWWSIRHGEKPQALVVAIAASALMTGLCLWKLNH